MSQQWYVIETKMRREKEAADEIQKLGFECFMPIEVRRRKDRSKKHRPEVEYTVAMFPRYIFPKFDIAQPCGWQHIGRLHSVKGWLKSALRETPSPIRSDFIDRVLQEQIAVRAALTNDQSIKFERIANGTRVIILDGPFATLGGIVDMSVGDRIKIMLDAANIPPIDIARHSVAAAS
jgi:transcriptional antiterminator RfaH